MLLFIIVAISDGEWIYSSTFIDAVAERWIVYSTDLSIPNSHLESLELREVKVLLRTLIFHY